jgi:hypothetical protein
MSLSRRQSDSVYHWLLTLVILTAVAILPSGVAAEDCSDITQAAYGRDCTATEEMAYCQLNAMDAYDDCKAQGGFLNDAGCFITYTADFWACAPELLPGV